jgi:hypothetical protein
MTLTEVFWDGTFTILVWGRYCRMKTVMNIMEKELEKSNL